MRKYCIRRHDGIEGAVQRVLGLTPRARASQADYNRVTGYLCKAIEDLFGRHNPDRDDLVLETIDKGWRYRCSWTGEGTAKSWLVSIARHLAIDRLRAGAKAGVQLYRQEMLDAEANRLSGESASDKWDHVFGIRRLRESIEATGDKKLIELLDARIAALDQPGRCTIGFTCSRAGITLKQYKSRFARLRTASRRLAPRLVILCEQS